MLSIPVIPNKEVSLKSGLVNQQLTIISDKAVRQFKLIKEYDPHYPFGGGPCFWVKESDYDCYRLSQDSNSDDLREESVSETLSFDEYFCEEEEEEEEDSNLLSQEEKSPEPPKQIILIDTDSEESLYEC